jgi:uncharacterized protein
MEGRLPTTINNFNIYLGETGDRFVGAGSIDLPEITMVTSELDVAGTAGKVSVPVLGHTDTMKTTISAPIATVEALRSAIPIGQLIIARGAAQYYESGIGVSTIGAFVVTMRGHLATAKPGKFQKATAMDSSFEFEVDYLKVDVEGVTIVEIDKFNARYIIDGVDYLAEVANAI